MSVLDIAEESNFIWGASQAGLVRVDKQSGEMTFWHTANSKIPRNDLTQVHVAQDGQKWVAGGNELARFDGHNWQDYEFESDINALVEDESGHIWIGTNTGLFRLSDGQRTTYLQGAEVLPTFETIGITALAFDATGALWTGAFGIHSNTVYPLLLRYDGQQWELVSHLFREVNALAVDSTGILWMGSVEMGVFGFDIQTRQGVPLHKPPPADIEVWSIYVDGNNHVWVATIYGVLEFDRMNWIWHYGQYEQDRWFGIGIFSILVSDSGIVWIGLSESIAQYVNSEWNDYLIANSVLSTNYKHEVVKVDKEGRIWIGGENELIEVVDGQWTVHQGPDWGFPESALRISDIAFDEDGNVLVASIAGVVKFDGTEWSPVLGIEDDGFSYRDIEAIAVDKQGTIWLSAAGGYGQGEGVASFNGESWTLYTTSNSNLGSNRVRDFAIDDDGNVWAATGAGLSKFDGSTWTTFSIGNRWDYMHSLAFDESGALWIGSYEGVLRYTGSWKVFDLNNSPFERQWVDEILYQNGTVWVGYRGNGVAMFDMNDDGAHFTDVNSGLCRDDVRGLAVEPNGKVWILTAYNGISIYNPQGSPVNVEEAGELPLDDDPISLQSYPNPFVSSLTISYQLSSVENGAPVEISIYNMLGQKIQTIMAKASSGVQELTWDGRDDSGIPVPSGLYLIRVKHKEYTSMAISTRIR